MKGLENVGLMNNALMILALADTIFPVFGFAQEMVVPRAKHLIIIGVDGMSPDGIRHAHTPVMDRLMREGSYSFHARSVLPSSSSSNWASMIMGVGPEMHGITSNDWDREEFMLPPVATGSEDIFPTIFGILRQSRPSAAIGAIYHWDGFGRLFEKNGVTFDHPAVSEEDAAATAVRYIREVQPAFTFVHLDHVDGAGHGFGHGSPGYYAAVSKADSLIGTILDAADRAGIASDMVVIISADHGGVGRGHGGESLEETEIPFIIAGKGIRKGMELHQPIYIYDIAATAAFITGVKPPYAWTGRPVLSAFEGEKLPTSEAFLAPLPPPAFVPATPGYAFGGTLFMGGPARVEVRYDGPAGDVRYTTDGTVPTTNSRKYAGPFTLDSGGVVKARAFAPDGRRSRTVTACYRVSLPLNGITYAYYEGPAWERLPDFAPMSPVRIGRVPEFRLDGVGTRNENYGVVLEALLRIEKPGRYEFTTISDDGSALFVNGRRVVDNDGDHGPRSKSGDIELTPGLVPVRAEYFNGGGGAWLDVLYKGPGIPRQIVPAHLLYPKP